MLFKDLDNQSVEFKIVNYQFPENIAPGDYDSNWLYININVKSKMGDWEKTDPSLLTSELEELIKWFSNLSNNIYGEVGFIEPNLDFSCIDKSDNSKTIRITFSAESKIPSMKSTEEECFIDFMLSNNELKKIAQELENELAKFPAR